MLSSRVKWFRLRDYTRVLWTGWEKKAGKAGLASLERDEIKIRTGVARNLRARPRLEEWNCKVSKDPRSFKHRPWLPPRVLCRGKFSCLHFFLPPGSRTPWPFWLAAQYGSFVASGFLVAVGEKVNWIDLANRAKGEKEQGYLCVRTAARCFCCSSRERDDLYEIFSFYFSFFHPFFRGNEISFRDSMS